MFREGLLTESLFPYFIVSVVAVIVSILFRQKCNRNLPPGPIGLPLVGYIPFLPPTPHLKLMELKKKYGPIYSLYLGSKFTVVLSDFASIKEAFSRDALLGRPPDSVFDLSEETIATGAINDIAWVEQRRHSLHILRDLGFGKSRMEEHVKEEILYLLEVFEKHGGEPLETSKLLAPSMSNNIASLLFGRRRELDDPKRILLDNLIRAVGSLVGKVVWLSFFPTLKKIVKFLGIGKQEELQNVFKQMKDYTTDEIKEHQSTLDPNNVRDYIDGYLLEIERRKHDPHTSFKVPVLTDLAGMFFGAGTDTVRITLDWLLLIAAGYPDVQVKIQQEIDSLIGRERFPTLADQHMMPYTTAVMMETWRWRASFPINFPRYTLQEMKLSSYTIPKHTNVVALFWAVHHDPILWGDDVHDFNPKRFLSLDLKEIRKPDHYIPFSTGKRSCPGESFAHMEVFLYLTSILQKFHIRLPEGVQANFEGQLSFGFQPKSYKLCLIPR